MSSRLTRRALFALPVALPVAAVAAKVEAVVPAPVRMIVGVDAGGLDDRFVLWVHTESCGGVESRHAAPVGSRKASDRKAWSGEPGGPSGTLNQITEPEVAPGPHDTDAQSVVA